MSRFNASFVNVLAALFILTALFGNLAHAGNNDRGIQKIPYSQRTHQVAIHDRDGIAKWTAALLEQWTHIHYTGTVYFCHGSEVYGGPNVRDDDVKLAALERFQATLVDYGHGWQAEYLSFTQFEAVRVSRRMSCTHDDLSFSGHVRAGLLGGRGKTWPGKRHRHGHTHSPSHDHDVDVTVNPDGDLSEDARQECLLAKTKKREFDAGLRQSLSRKVRTTLSDPRCEALPVE